MTVPVPKWLLTGALLAVLAAGPVGAADVYKSSLDPAIPHHAAILDTLSRLEKEPGSAALHNDLGCLVAWDGFWRDALRSFEKASELDPKDSRPWFNAGLVKGLRGDWRGARSSFRKAVKVDPGNWPGWWMLGYAQESLGNEDAAVDAYSRALRVDTSLFDPRINPFAVGSRLKSRVLLETYERRLVDAAIPFTNQLQEPSRVAAFFQKKPEAPPAGSVEIQEPPKTGPVVMSVAPPSRVVAPSTSAPQAPSPMTSRRRRSYARDGADGAPVEVAPATPRRPPDVTDAPPGPDFGTGAGAPGSGAAAAPAAGATPPRRVPGPGGAPTTPPDGE